LASGRLSPLLALEIAEIVVPEYPARTFPATMESSAEAVDSSTGDADAARVG
jgi:hypothetical protein